MIDTITQIRHTPHVWQVGDLIDHHKEGACLLIDLNADDTRTYMIYLSQSGKQYELSEEEATQYYWYNTGLIYTYQNRQQVQEDFNRSFFKPYFELE